MNTFLSVSVCIMIFTAASLGKTVLQTPDNLIKNKDDSALIMCSHKISSYYIILWYKQSPDMLGLKLMGYLNNDAKNKEPEFDNKIKLEGNGRNNGNLTINTLKLTDSAVYFCAAYKGGGTTTAQAHFGEGTKLTVLDPEVGIQEPDVKILNVTRCTEKVTLVCVAENFYPDHVSIQWSLGSKNIMDDVATDPYATQYNATMFRISSRLKVPKKEFTPKNTYTCTVTFYDGKAYTNKTATITGTGVGGYEPEDYLKSSKTIKLAYGVFIAKSALYGLVIFVFVWRKGSSGK